WKDCARCAKPRRSSASAGPRRAQCLPDSGLGLAPMPSPTTSPARPRAGLARFDTLRVKLFLAIAGANVVLVMAAYLIYGWSFDKGLVEYLNRADETRLQPLVVRLADGHRQH